MNFMQLLQSLDNLLYEVMSWLVFFPITLWRTVSRPLQMMEYADSELKDRPERQYEDTLSPPLFLLLALLVSHSIGLAFGEGVNPIVASKTGLAAYIDSDGKLLLLRLVFFSIVPLMLAAALLIGLRQPVTRERLKPPFYAQCYPAGAFALALGTSVLLMHDGPDRAKLVGGAMLVVTLATYFSVQVAWFRRYLKRGLLVATGYAAVALVGGMTFSIVFGLLFT
jgi:hypothetical protein